MGDKMILSEVGKEGEDNKGLVKDSVGDVGTQLDCFKGGDVWIDKCRRSCFLL